MVEEVVTPLPVHYLPIATTILSLVFFTVIVRRYKAKGKGAHLVWWAAGVLAYGIGTALEGAITLFGNTILLNKAWYVAGAILGGYPLAQGTVYLLLSRKTANTLTAISVPVIIGTAVLVIMSPVNVDALEPFRPSGAILTWQWVRALTPFINLYAMYFLVGGAILSAVRFSQKKGTASRALGNTLIAIGAMLPAIGGAMTKAGYVEALYVGEFAGIILIWAGYTACVRHTAESTFAVADPDVSQGETLVQTTPSGQSGGRPVPDSSIKDQES